MSNKQLLNISRACMLILLVLLIIGVRFNFKINCSPVLGGIIVFVIAGLMNITNTLASQYADCRNWKWYYWMPNLILPLAVGVTVFVIMS